MTKNSAVLTATAILLSVFAYQMSEPGHLAMALWSLAIGLLLLAIPPVLPPR
jgi:hypothetical protein